MLPLLSLLGLLVLAAVPGPRPLAAQAGAHTFAETGQTVAGRFWAVWQGGRPYADSLYLNGLPLTDAHDETSLTDGKVYRVQWFERARLEAHPENPPPADVLLGLLGVQAARGRQDAPFAPVAPPAGGTPWFQQTGHTLGDPSAGGQAIAALWTRLGGLPQFGYPLSQPFLEPSRDDGRPYLVQYFERQRFEYHPEHAGTRFAVLLGRLGAEQLGTRGSMPPAPSATPAAGPVPPLPAGWLARFNAYRAAAGLPPVVEDPQLTAGAVAHVNYMLQNPDEYKHDETPGAPGFTPAGQQAARDGNLFRASPGFTVAAALDGWMASLYHRFGMLNPQLTRSGFALACDTRGCAAALNVLSATDGSPQPAGVVYPGAGQQGVDTGLITWQFGSFDPPVEGATAGLRDAHGTAVPITVDQAAGFWNVISVKPVQPLAPATTYTVEISATQHGQALHKIWSFRTK